MVGPYLLSGFGCAFHSVSGWQVVDDFLIFRLGILNVDGRDSLVLCVEWVLAAGLKEQAWKEEMLARRGAEVSAHPNVGDQVGRVIFERQEMVEIRRDSFGNQILH